MHFSFLKNSMLFLEEDNGGGGGGSQTLLSGESGSEGQQQQQQQQQQQVTTGLIGQDGNFVNGWVDQLGEDFKGSHDALAPFKSPADLAKSYLHTKSLVGKKGVIIPTEKSTPEEIAAFRSALGVPEKPEGYQLKPEKLPEGLSWSDDLAKPFATIAHKHNIPPAAMREIVSEYVNMQAASTASAEQMVEAELQKGAEFLRSEFKQDFDKNITMAKRVAKTVGLDPNSPGLRDPNVVVALVRFAGMMSEDKIVQGDIQTTLNPGKQKAHEIMTNPEHPQYKDYHGQNGQQRQQEVAKIVNDLLKNG